MDVVSLKVSDFFFLTLSSHMIMTVTKKVSNFVLFVNNSITEENIVNKNSCQHYAALHLILYST